MVMRNRARRAPRSIGIAEQGIAASPANDSKPRADLSTTYMSPDELKESARNARTHSGKQVRQIVASIEKNGFVNPVLVDEKFVLIAGHGRVMAAKKLELSSIPVIVLTGLSEMQKRQLAIADNAIASNAGWDLDKLTVELSDFVALDDFEPLSIGFEPADIDRMLFEREERSADPADVLPKLEERQVSRTGDMYQLGHHRLLCGDSRAPADFDRLMAGDQAAMALLDRPTTCA